MQIVDLSDQHKDLFAVCLEDWSPEAKEAGPRRREWVDRYLARGLRAKLALDDQGNVGGMIQYLPIEESFVDGAGLYFVPCIWVHGHKKGRGNFQKRGMGKALLAAAEEDARARGAKGMAAWGLALPFWMKASWFKKQGYRPADRRGISALMWKPFTADATAPKWFPETKPADLTTPGKVNVTAYVNGWCMANNLKCERAARAAAAHGEGVAFQIVDTCERGAAAGCGLTDALFVDGKQVGGGPPPSYDKLYKIIGKRVRRLKPPAG